MCGMEAVAPGAVTSAPVLLPLLWLYSTLVSLTDAKGKSASLASFRAVTVFDNAGACVCWGRLCEEAGGCRWGEATACYEG